MSGVIIEKMDAARHNRENFDCGVEVLNVFLKQRANQEQKKRLNVTYVAVQGQNISKPILGYYTLSNSSLSLYMVQEELKKQIPPTYTIPSVKIGRLAVDKSTQNNGLGRLLLRHVFKKIIDAASITGIRGVEVIAKNPEATRYYEKLGFIRLKDSENLLFMPVETIINALPE